jgi:hypothetical protein
MARGSSSPGSVTFRSPDVVTGVTVDVVTGVTVDVVTGVTVVDVTGVTVDDATGATVEIIGWTVIWGTSLCVVVLMATAGVVRIAVGLTTIVAVWAGVWRVGWNKKYISILLLDKFLNFRLLETEKNNTVPFSCVWHLL